MLNKGQPPRGDPGAAICLLSSGVLFLEHDPGGGDVLLGQLVEQNGDRFFGDIRDAVELLCEYPGDLRFLLIGLGCDLDGDDGHGSFLLLLCAF